MNKFMQVERKIENSVVSGYKAIENSVVSGYKKIEDKFVEAFLTPDETSKQNGGYNDEKGSSANEPATHKETPTEILESGILTGLSAIENGVSVGVNAIMDALAADDERS